MIRFHAEPTDAFINQSALDNALDAARGSFRSLQEENGAGKEWLGWRRILKDSPENALSELPSVLSTAARITEKADTVVIAGIGGSYLGAKALIEILRPKFSTSSPEILFTGFHMGGAELQDLTRHLSNPVLSQSGSGDVDREVFVNVISKSGSTLETSIAFRVLRHWLEQRYGAHYGSRIAATTGPTGGLLNPMADQWGFDRFVIPNDVGGRFSVLTPVGLLPLAIAGIDVKSLLEGAMEAFQALEENPEPVLEYAAFRYAFHQDGKAIDVIGSFEPELTGFIDWIQQLFGESEGKEGKGLFPVPVAYSTDLHSIGQMVQQGRRNLIETFLQVMKSTSNLKIPKDDKDIDKLNDLSDLTVYEINQSALEGTIEAHLKGGVPVCRVQIPDLSPRTLGQLIYFYELTTSVHGYMLGVNPFDQPGVEDYKKAMYRRLGRSS